MSNSFIPRTVPADRCVPLVRALVAMPPTSYRLPTMGTACSHRTRRLGQWCPQPRGHSGSGDICEATLRSSSCPRSGFHAVSETSRRSQARPAAEQDVVHLHRLD